MGNCFIIAEGGLNHNGNLETAKQLASIAKDCGASSVKFQTFFHDKWPELNHLRFTKQEWVALFAYCDSIGMKWFSTPFDFEAIDFLKSCGMDIWKIPSGKAEERWFIEKICEVSKPTDIYIASTGMCDKDEIMELKYSFKTGCRARVTLLHCVSSYPTKVKDVNLKAMCTMRNDFSCDIGLSDHTLGIEIPIAAVALGATIIEKHLTMNRNQDGPDHRASLEPNEFKEMVRCIRNVELAIGDGIKKPTPSELKVRDLIRERMKVN